MVRMIQKLVDDLEETMVELQCCRANCPPEARELLPTSFWEKTEEMLQLGNMVQGCIEDILEANLEGNFEVQIKSLLEVMDVLQKLHEAFWATSRAVVPRYPLKYPLDAD